VDVSIGLKPGEPVFLIPDAAPHSDKDLRDRKYSLAGETTSAATEVTELLTDKHKITEEDLVSAAAKRNSGKSVL